MGAAAHQFRVHVGLEPVAGHPPGTDPTVDGCFHERQDFDPIVAIGILAEHRSAFVVDQPASHGPEHAEMFHHAGLATTARKQVWRDLLLFEIWRQGKKFVPGLRRHFHQIFPVEQGAHIGADPKRLQPAVRTVHPGPGEGHEIGRVACGVIGVERLQLGVEAVQEERVERGEVGTAPGINLLLQMRHRSVDVVGLVADVQRDVGVSLQPGIDLGLEPEFRLAVGRMGRLSRAGQPGDAGRRGIVGARGPCRRNHRRHQRCRKNGLSHLHKQLPGISPRIQQPCRPASTFPVGCNHAGRRS